MNPNYPAGTPLSVDVHMQVMQQLNVISVNNERQTGAITGLLRSVDVLHERVSTVEGEQRDHAKDIALLKGFQQGETAAQDKIEHLEEIARQNNREVAATRASDNTGIIKQLINTRLFWISITIIVTTGFLVGGSAVVLQVLDIWRATAK